MVASFPGVEYAKLHYRLLDNAKTVALAKSKGKFYSIMTLSDSARSDLQWWIENLCSAYKTITGISADCVKVGCLQQGLGRGLPK